jgi:hypothetical protein
MQRTIGVFIGLLCLGAGSPEGLRYESGTGEAVVTETILREIARVERDLARAASQEDRAPAEARLKRASEAARRGRAFLALHDLSVPWRMQAAYTMSAGLVDRVKTIEDFKREWSAMGEPAVPRPASGLPLVVTAFATSSESVGPATYRASLPYAEDAGLQAGLFYLGDARAAGEFGSFCRTLKFASAGAVPTLRSVAPEMDRFERDVLKLYDKADAAARRSFIGVNVGMKIARERDTSRDYAAALLQYLLARYQLGVYVTKEPGADAAERIAAFARALTGVDHTIAQLFFEMAAAGLENPDAAGRRQATAIADFVLPEYTEILKR